MHDIGCLRPFAGLKLSFWLFGSFFFDWFANLADKMRLLRPFVFFGTRLVCSRLADKMRLLRPFVFFGTRLLDWKKCWETLGDHR